MDKKKYIETQKDCAKLLGQTMSEYSKSLKHIKSTKFKNTPSNENRTLQILKKLGLSESDLKKRIC